MFLYLCTRTCEMTQQRGDQIFINHTEWTPSVLYGHICVSHSVLFFPTIAVSKMPTADHLAGELNHVYMNASLQLAPFLSCLTHIFNCHLF